MRNIKIVVIIIIFGIAMAGCTILSIREKKVSSGKYEKGFKFVTLEGESSHLTLKWKIYSPKKCKKIILKKKEYSGNIGELEIISKDDIEEPIKISPKKNRYDFEHPAYETFNYSFIVQYEDGTEIKREFNRVYKIQKNIIMEKIGGRKVAVYLPPGYNKNLDKRYPVIYAQDGQAMLIKYAEGMDCMVDESIDKYVKSGKMKEVIVVAIYSTNKRRQEYVPYLGQNEKSLSKEYGNYVVNKIIPFIDTKYRTIPNRENRGLIGFSYGAYISLWLLYNYDDIFSFAGALSLSFDSGEYQFLDDIKKIGKRNIRIWISQGTHEYGDETFRLLKLWSNQGYKYGKNIFFYQDSDGYHDYNNWKKFIIYPIMTFLNPKGTKMLNVTSNVSHVINDKGTGFDYYLNAIVETESGAKYTLFDGAKYKSLDGRVEFINSSWKFKPIAKKNSKVEISFKGKKIKTVIDYKEIEKAKNGYKFRKKYN
ncbi:alpha/beta hydrolase [Haliovirga abyssi]|uniref:Esterase n=1 Tax=Haliovirga abyssi TaxID=2996794 RepID=A0AAU9DRI2_9FUSO|nr:alpha/beta hydrolase-fold protein [Haliovirga abyssi]BDU51193.1 hypothetical protein HLVA_17620 [Haliovirga abyssi]